MPSVRINPAQLVSLDPHVYLRIDRYRNSSPITFDGRTQTLVEWAAEVGLNVLTLRNRLNRMSWPVERALTTARLDHTWDTRWRERLADKQVTIGEDTLPIAWWARIRGLKQATVQMRLQRGCSVEEALTPGKIQSKRGRTPRARSDCKCGRCGQTGHIRKSCNASIYAAARHLAPACRPASEGGASR